MVQTFVICLLAIIIPIIDSKNINTIIPKKDNQVVPIDNKMDMLQNETIALQKNSVAQENKTSIKQDRSEIKQTPKIRQVSSNGLVTTPSTVMDDMNAEQSAVYQSPLMVYPFSMINTYHPRYFPYTYPAYQSYPYFG